MSYISGIDVSHYQQKIDWAAVARSGGRFCFVKATEGSGVVDSQFHRNWEGAQGAGIIRGAYHFFHAGIAAVAQADLFFRTLDQLQPGDLPPVLDLEAPAEWNAIRTADRVPLALQWLELVERHFGITPIVYLSPSFATETLANAPVLERFPLWIAHYTCGPLPTIPKPWKCWTIWQYLEKGSAPGVTGRVDLNRFNGSFENLKAMTKT